MIKKLLALALCLTIFTAQANGRNQELENLFKDLNIALEVEWDQKDKAKYQEIVGQFQEKLSDLQKQGLTNQELIAFTSQNVVNKSIAKELNDVFSRIEADKMNQKEAREFAFKHMSKFYAEGSSWAGRGGYVAWVSVIAVLAIAGLIAAVSVGGGNVYVNTSTCYDEYVCYDYYDYYWGWYTDCGWYTYCY